MAQPQYYVGIDLGTTYSSVAYYNPTTKLTDLVRIKGQVSIPSKVYLEENKTSRYGDEADRLSSNKAQNVIYDSKRMLGLKFSKIRKFVKSWPFQVQANRSQDIEIKVGNMTLKPLEISSYILKFLKTEAEQALNTEISSVVITHPQQFNPKQIEETKTAAQLAGFKEVGLICEPTAAVLTIFDDLEKNKRHKILVYDFGGGTFDVSVAEVFGQNINVTTTDGNAELGGQDIDMELVDHFANKIKEQYDYDIKAAGNANYFSMTKCNSKALKERLSSGMLSDEFVLDLPCGQFKYTMRKREFEEIIKPIIMRTIEKVRDVVKKECADENEVQAMKIMLVGGSSLIPLVKTLLKDELKIDDKNICNAVDQLGAVARGGAIWRYQLCRGRDPKPSSGAEDEPAQNTKPSATTPKPGASSAAATSARRRVPIDSSSDSESDIKPKRNPSRPVTKPSGTVQPARMRPVAVNYSDSGDEPVTKPKPSTGRRIMNDSDTSSDSDIVSRQRARQRPTGTASKPGASNRRQINVDSSSDDDGLTITQRLPRSIGLKVLDSNGNPFITPILRKGNILPTSGKQTFANAGDDDEEITLEVYWGDDKDPEKCHWIAAYNIPIDQSGGPVKAQSVIFIVNFKVSDINIITCEVQPITNNVSAQTFEVKNALDLSDAEIRNIHSNIARIEAVDNSLVNVVSKFSENLSKIINNVANMQQKREIRHALDELENLIDEINEQNSPPQNLLDKLKQKYEAAKAKYSNLLQ